MSGMKLRALRRFALAATLLASASVVTAPALADPMRIAFGDIATVETLHLMAAIERAREAGVEIDVTYLKSEDIAAQAVVSGQADIGVGGPYALIQKVRAPIRIFMQLSTLQMYPVVDGNTYKEWKDLDGQEVAVHSRGSGTEALMQLAAQQNGISYSRISYIPGAEVRTGALLQGNVKATIVDASGRRILEREAPDRFIFLPLDTAPATDEALFANTDYLRENEEDVAKLVEAILTTWREVAENPAVMVELREKYNLLPDASAETVAEIEPYFTGAAEAGLPVNGGGEAAARGDFEFYTVSGALTGEPSELKVEDFWDLDALNAALAKLGSS
ncbi:ABC transporter substrate-binding protein [Aureimonas sp. OT7]|uniref:ABC transporter substrate-binding protein n=1 Tax=Aureimonas sp. OT7 TaxID=2816454 RepID=UPI0017833986|nr:ABC transporter substrate-binding protein [Aureimonas sp. OT7]QOG05374.1 ABC transporter substrate-binding protein [Aureimonas sp. OT7]